MIVSFASILPLFSSPTGADTGLSFDCANHCYRLPFLQGSSYYYELRYRLIGLCTDTLQLIFQGKIDNRARTPIHTHANKGRHTARKIQHLVTTSLSPSASCRLHITISTLHQLHQPLSQPSKRWSSSFARLFGYSLNFTFYCLRVTRHSGCAQ